jgi:hypothetical protein
VRDRHVREPNIPRTTVSYVVATPKPRIVRLVITPHGEEAFSTGISKRKAIDYDVKVEIGGVAGFVAHVGGELLKSRSYGRLV